MKTDKNYYKLFSNISIEQLKKMIKQKEIEIKKEELQIAKLDVISKKNN